MDHGEPHLAHEPQALRRIEALRRDHALGRDLPARELGREDRGARPHQVARGRRPEAVMMPYDQYLKFVEMNESGVLRRFDQAVARMAAANARYTDDEVEADLIAATRTVRRMARKRS